MNSFLGDNALVKIVKLTIETNLLTSEYTLVDSAAIVLTRILAAVALVSLLMVVIYSVSDLKITIGSGADTILI